MTDEDEKDKDDKDKDEQSDEGGDKGEHHGLEDEIEEILRQQGEKPGRAQRPRPPGQGLPIPGLAAFVLRYGFYLAVGAGLIFLLVRVLGPVAFRFILMAAFVFLLFYTLRGLLQEIIRRRSR